MDREGILPAPASASSWSAVEFPHVLRDYCKNNLTLRCILLHTLWHILLHKMCCVGMEEPMVRLALQQSRMLMT